MKSDKGEINAGIDALALDATAMKAFFQHPQNVPLKHYVEVALRKVREYLDTDERFRGKYELAPRVSLPTEDLPEYARAVIDVAISEYDVKQAISLIRHLEEQVRPKVDEEFSRGLGNAAKGWIMRGHMYVGFDVRRPLEKRLR